MAGLINVFLAPHASLVDLLEKLARFFHFC